MSGEDGVLFSNTFTFERDRGWSGVCIEANPKVFPALAANRSARCLNVAVSSGMRPFVQVEAPDEMLSGLLEEMDPRHLERIHREIEETSGSSTVIQVPTMPLSKILGDLHLTEVHYLSVDTEGNKANVLASVDFNPVMIHVITVEAAYTEARETLTLALRSAFSTNRPT
jgi:FkbM family methyltransferase